MPSMSSPPVIDRDGSRPIKRKKTTRACDHCRAHRIRCEYVTSQGDCRHCIEYGFDCIKVAPAPPDKRRLLSLSTKSDDTLDTSQGLEPGYLGGTSLTQLVYTTCSTSSPRKPNIKRKLDQLDIQYDHYWESLDRTDGLGLLVGRDETSAPSASVSSSRSSGTGGSRVAKFSSLQARLAAELGSETLMDSLFDTCLQRVIPLFPVISATEAACGTGKPPEMWWHRFSVWHTNSGPPTPLPPVVRLIHCTISSLSRDVPPSIRRSLLSALHEHLDNGEIAALSKTSSLANAQVLLLLSMNLELHAHEGSSAVSLLWQRAGVGLRMATELATHRNVSSSVVPIAQLHRRWRVWGACIITDRWLGLSQGQIMSINLEDCDAPLPFVYPDHFPDEAHSEGPACFSFFHELTKLSILLGRILRLTSTPSGLDRADDLGFYRLQRDLDSWEKGLPTTWAYSSKLDMPQGDPVFALLSVATEFTFLRSFMWPTRPIPTHISFRPDTSRWTNLILKAQQVIDWLATPLGAFHLDIWSITIYPLVCCAMIQLRSYRDTNDCVALQYLEKANTITQAWATEEGTVRPSRKKVADMVLVLFDMADGDGGGSSVLPVEEVLVSAFMS
ncbi:hypothetical protein CI109_103298 [Kwoniella shandongensis]|uniref:Uncharacterized protein n=1 Tax=Kwoniella shandongensis TaxID=1734106 RepID=A0A5M6BX47_9TREE|nr:uncharacterized protein CI109_006030 [Kwoniella shandongensis]KAA5525579.1 hypothetical protein CI109_006030 [Kwoniella shandongensis]